jgi:hypothetical protein
MMKNVDCACKVMLTHMIKKQDDEILADDETFKASLNELQIVCGEFGEKVLEKSNELLDRQLTGLTGR